MRAFVLSVEGGSDMAEDPADYVRPTDDNVTYNLWNLGNITLLVRCRYDGVMHKKQGVCKINQTSI